MNTRPDIAFAVSQVAWFNSNPEQSHASAVKMIISYLLPHQTKALLCGCGLCWITWKRTSRPICKCLLSYRIHYVLLLLPSHLEKSTSNRNCTQHLPSACCPLISHPKPHHHPMISPRTCTLPTHDLHNSCHPC